MRTIPALAILAALATSAAAGPLQAFDESVVPASCRVLERAMAPTPQMQLSKRISVATCMASVRLGDLRTTQDPQATIDALTAAAMPSMAMLDEVIANGDPAAQVLAQHAKGDLYVGLAVRLRNTVPSVTDFSKPSLMAQHHKQLALVDPTAETWVRAGDRAFTEVTRLATSSGLRGDPVIAEAIALSRSELAATRNDVVVGIR